MVCLHYMCFLCSNFVLNRMQFFGAARYIGLYIELTMTCLQNWNHIKVFMHCSTHLAAKLSEIPYTQCTKHPSIHMTIKHNPVYRDTVTGTVIQQGCCSSGVQTCDFSIHQIWQYCMTLIIAALPKQLGTTGLAKLQCWEDD